MTREVNCMNCMVGRFKDDLCDEKMCEALKRIGKSDDFVDIIMLAKEIVRCKDCRYYNPIDECKPYPCSYGLYMCNKDDYCSYGEQRR